MLATLIELVPYDPGTSGTVTLRASSVDDSRVCSLNGQAWWPAVATRPKLSVDGFDGNYSGQIAAGAGSLALSLAPFPNAARYAWADKRCRIWTGNVGDAWGSYTLRFDGLVSGATVSRGRIAVSLKVNDSWLDRPLLNLAYGGTGGNDGPAALKGTPKPLCLGTPQFVEPQLIDAVNNVYQLSGYGAIHGVTALLDRLVRFPFGPTGNDANYAALIGAAIAAGEWRTCLAEGLVRLGAPPAGVLCALVEGDSGSSYGWVRKPGAVISRIASLAGATSGQINATSMTALDTAVPYNLSLAISAQTTARQLIQTIAASCNAAAGVDWLGALYVAPVAIGSPALTLRSDGTSLPPVASVDVLAVGSPFWRMQMEAAHTWRVHTTGEFGQYDYTDLANQPASLSDINSSEGSKLTGIEAGADVTASNAPDLTGNFAWAIDGDVAGTVTTVLPANRRFIATEGGSNVSTTTSFAISGATSGVALTVNNTTDKGLVTLGSGTTGSGSAILTATLPSGGIVERIIQVTKTNAAAPSTGGAGATFAQDTSFNNVTSGSHANISDELVVRSDGSNHVRIAASANFGASATADQNIAVKFAYATSSGGSLTDLITEVTANFADWVAADNTLYDGDFSIAEATFTMPAPNTDYYFRLRGRRVTGSATIVFNSANFTVRQ